MILIERIHPQIWIYKTIINLPFPLSNRYFAHYIFEINPSPNRTIFVYLPCLPEDLQKFPKCNIAPAILNMAIWDFEKIPNSLTCSRKFSEKNSLLDSNFC